jgi:aldose 1-epimerase
METLRSGGGRLEATFHPEAGMVGSSLRAEGAEVLGQRGGLEAYVSRGSTFGIPLLHPWANRLSGYEYLGVTLERDECRVDEHGLPIHGLATRLPWEVLDRRDDALIAGFDGAAIAAGFPFAHRLTLTAEVSDEALTLTATLAATGADRVPVAFGFHPYLACDRADAALVIPVREHLLLDERGIPTGEAVPMEPIDGPLGDGTYDNLYTAVVGSFVLQTQGRTVRVTFEEGYPYAQVYAPEGQALVCFEPMTAPTNALISGDGLRFVEPGGTFSARFAISPA